jgi:hypothetical protein
VRAKQLDNGIDNAFVSFGTTSGLKLHFSSTPQTARELPHAANRYCAPGRAAKDSLEIPEESRAGDSL